MPDERPARLPKELLEGIIAVDDVSGAWLRPEIVAQARKDEIKYFREMGVYEKVNIDECWTRTGKAPIAVRTIYIQITAAG